MMASVAYTKPLLDDFGVPRTALPAELQSELDTIRWVAYYCVELGDAYQRLLSWEVHHDPRLAFIIPTHSCYQSFRQAQQFYKELKSHAVKIESPFVFDLNRRLRIDGLVEQREAIAKLRASDVVIEHYVKENNSLDKELKELKERESKSQGQLALGFFRDLKLKKHIHDRDMKIRQKEEQLSENDRIINELREALDASKKASAQLQEKRTESMFASQTQSRVSASNLTRVTQQLKNLQKKYKRAKLDLDEKESIITTLEYRLESSEASRKKDCIKKNNLKSELLRLVQMCEAWGGFDNYDDSDDSDDTSSAVASIKASEDHEAQEHIENAHRCNHPSRPPTAWSGTAEIEVTCRPLFQRSSAPSPPSSPTPSFLVGSGSSLVSFYPDSIG